MKPFACAVLFAMLAACSKPEPPDKERPVEPQARQATELRDAVRGPIDKAARVEDALDAAAQAQRTAIEAAGG